MPVKKSPKAKALSKAKSKPKSKNKRDANAKTAGKKDKVAKKEGKGKVAKRQKNKVAKDNKVAKGTSEKKPRVAAEKRVYSAKEQARRQDPIFKKMQSVTRLQTVPEIIFSQKVGLIGAFSDKEISPGTWNISGLLYCMEEHSRRQSQGRRRSPETVTWMNCNKIDGSVES